MAIFTLGCLSGGAFCLPVWADDDAPEAPAEPSDYQSRHLLVHTDLPEAEAQKLLVRLEATLTAISDYWQSPLRGMIECYVIADIDHWCDANALPKNVSLMIRSIGGATDVRRESSGKQSAFLATVYAVARPGVPEHEVVHAYCIQTFGAMGPDWYKEGMAQMSHIRREGERGVACAPEVLACFRDRPRRTVQQIVSAGTFTSRIGKSLEEALVRGDKLTIETQDHDEIWLRENAAAVEQAFQSYYWSWALCHLLHHNPNYSARFRMLGRSYLSRRDETFERVFGSMSDKIAFEYQFFVDHIDQGYRADLCAWDWTKKFRSLVDGEEVVTRVLAARGYQPSGLDVSAGQDYTYRTEGTWTLSPGAEATGAAGDAQEHGGLEAVVMRKGLALSEPILLKAEGVLNPPSDGRLYLRCRDDWNKLDDNQGSVLVRFRKGQ
ncbi:MAG: hypothetical protein HY000_33740 [Planctomycetes bacterium]|nr:hypothetical protein [Planctomycetota bacterium]